MFFFTRNADLLDFFSAVDMPLILPLQIFNVSTCQLLELRLAFGRDLRQLLPAYRQRCCADPEFCKPFLNNIPTKLFNIPSDFRLVWSIPRVRAHLLRSLSPERAKHELWKHIKSTCFQLGWHSISAV